MKTLGLRGRVILGFAAGALLLSVVLTTVTDVCGFLSFLGIATLLAGMLE